MFIVPSDLIGSEIEFSAFDIRLPVSRGEVELTQSSM